MRLNRADTHLSNAGITAKFLLLLCLGLHSCRETPTERKITRSFYYWKSIFKLSDFEVKRLDSLEVKTIHLKYFDVDWDDLSRRPVPKARMIIRDKALLQKFQVIPTVFITNECIQKLDSLQTHSLAGKIVDLIKDLSTLNDINDIPEIQVDCDWTAGSRENYFSLLRYIKQQLKPGILLSTTIRLHQVKYQARSGVPPADKGLLMCYNMGNLKNPFTRNSIIETAELQKYTGNISSYPIPLDIGLPLFEWKVLFRERVYAGLIQNLPTELLKPSFTVRKDNNFQMLKDTLLNGYALRKGDVLRSEESKTNEVLAAGKVINTHLKNTHPLISLYHLDSVTLSKYATNELENLYDCFH